MIKSKSVLALVTTIFAIILGVMFGDFFTNNSLGVQVPIFVGALISLTLLLKFFYKGEEGFNLYDLLFIPYWLVSLGFAYHQSQTLLNLNLAILSIFFLPLVYMSYRPRVFKRFSYFNSLLVYIRNLVAGLMGLAGFLGDLLGFNKFIKIENRNAIKISLSVLVGILIAIPVLIVFGLLFASADYAFKDVFNNLDPSFSIETVIIIVLAIGLFLYSFIGLMWANLDDLVLNQRYDSDRSKGISAIIQIVFLTLINLLFITFIIVQIVYLFGEHDKIVELGLTYSEYARKGFWELQAVSILSFIIMYFLIRFGVAKSTKAKILTKSLISLFALSIFIIIASALKRMDIYVDGYGLTELRFYTSAFMIFEAVLFAYLAIANIERKIMKYFSLYSLLAGFLALIILNVIVPDRYIARTNIDRYENGKTLDVVYLVQLSSDSYMELDNVSFEVKDLYYCELAGKFEEMKADTSSWKEYNYSRSKSFEQISELEEDFTPEKCENIAVERIQTFLDNYADEMVKEDFAESKKYWGVDSEYEDMSEYIDPDLDIISYEFSVDLYSPRGLEGGDNLGNKGGHYLTELDMYTSIDAKLIYASEFNSESMMRNTVCRSEYVKLDVINGSIKMVQSNALPLYFKKEDSWKTKDVTSNYLQNMLFQDSNCTAKM
ncbi:MAG: DUF4173 domain-containing protein [Candidatus Lokiarchaeota archaeon]|nr:DUF4173 domain-containing protein [Candidatus Lokiarchaeota archaeon]